MLWIALPLALLVALVAAEILRLLLSGAPRHVHRVSLGSATLSRDAKAPQIPKIIWSYWQQAPTPELIARCIANWRQLAPDHQVRVLSRADIGTWLPQEALIQDLDSLPAYRQADWLRLQLLAQHGGIWVDASTIFTQNLDWLHSWQQQAQSEYAGFYIDKVTRNPSQPIVENWFMAAVPQCAFILDLIGEFARPLERGEQAYLDELRQEGIYDSAVQGLGSGACYLIMHVAASALLHRNPEKYRLALLCAEDTAFCFHAALGWRKRHIYARLALCPCPKRLPPLVKLRGVDRRIFEPRLARGQLYSASFLRQYLYT